MVGPNGHSNSNGNIIWNPIKILLENPCYVFYNYCRAYLNKGKTPGVFCSCGCFSICLNIQMSFPPLATLDSPWCYPAAGHQLLNTAGYLHNSGSSYQATSSRCFKGIRADKCYHADGWYPLYHQCREEMLAELQVCLLLTSITRHLRWSSSFLSCPY